MGERSELHWACSQGDLRKAVDLIAKASVDPVDELGWTPLMIASSAGHLDIVSALIESGANVNACNNNGQTSLHYAVSKNHVRIASLLTEHGADINARDNYGMTPLHRAAAKGHLPIVELLVKCNKLDINVCDDLGNTPLHFASEEDRLDVCKLLLQSGAQPSMLNKESQSAIDLSKSTSVLHLLRNALNSQ
ncbi:26S proteasome non-ATPase regulatory subunit 10-like protein [Dinothrombium tinctorium]|uniref:26S proteasome non-ATPase regulatory subunit 10-like protein n=1 Tax=Dinothrombium tinctorium TaxID=1965070 RepID=A0A3S3NP82_9ACAR|nr:26S proteasome non-ATPase regulatory subunit 10-like protein [Dinothrombium tinctorium]RWS08877.1 26S proteasome non-ATPase regulatory subunit 10-like protein [Dinothrombium tinctorium]